MHRVLQTFDLLNTVAAFLPTKNDQLSMGLSCRMFFEPAMDELWHTLPSIHCIQGCFPTGLLLTTKTQHGSILVFDRCPQPEDLSNFLKYAWRVRTLYTLQIEMYKKSCEVVRKKFPKGPLFPNLKRLHMGGPRRIYELGILLSGARTQELIWDVTPGEDDAWRFNIIHARHLKVLKYNIPDEPHCAPGIKLFLAINTTISCFDNLVELDLVAQYQRSALIHLSRLPSLTRLALALCDHNCRSLPLLDNGVQLFSALKHLRIQVLHTADTPFVTNRVTGWLRDLQFPLLVSLHIFSLQPLFTSSETHPNPTEDLFNLIVAEFKNLTSLRLHFNMPQYKTSPHRADGAILESLARNLHLLDDFALCNFPFNPSSGFIKMVAAAWPRLRHLRINEGCWSHAPTIQLYDLWPLAERCPDLLSLRLALDAHMPAVTDDLRFSNPNVKVLHISHVFALDAIAHVAAFVAQVFPSADLAADASSDETLRKKVEKCIDKVMVCKAAYMAGRTKLG